MAFCRGPIIAAHQPANGPAGGADPLLALRNLVGGLDDQSSTLSHQQAWQGGREEALLQQVQPGHTRQDTHLFGPCQGTARQFLPDMGQQPRESCSPFHRWSWQHFVAMSATSSWMRSQATRQPCRALSMPTTCHGAYTTPLSHQQGRQGGREGHPKVPTSVHTWTFDLGGMLDICRLL